MINQKILERENLRIIVEAKQNYMSERIEIKDGDSWISVIGNNEGFSSLNIWTKIAIYSKSLTFIQKTKGILNYQLKDKDLSMDLKYFLEENNVIHVRYIITPQRKWLLRVLPKEKLEELIKILSTYRIAEILGLSHSVIKRFVKNVYDLEIPICRDVSEPKLKYWTKFLDKIGKYPNK